MSHFLINFLLLVCVSLSLGGSGDLLGQNQGQHLRVPPVMASAPHTSHVLPSLQSTLHPVTHF